MKIIVYGQFVRAALIGLMQKIKALWCPLPKKTLSKEALGENFGDLPILKKYRFAQVSQRQSSAKCFSHNFISREKNKGFGNCCTLFYLVLSSYLTGVE